MLLMPGKKGCNCVDEIVVMISNALFFLKGMIGNGIMLKTICFRVQTLMSLLK